MAAQKAFSNGDSVGCTYIVEMSLWEYFHIKKMNKESGTMDCKRFAIWIKIY